MWEGGSGEKKRFEAFRGVRVGLGCWVMLSGVCRCDRDQDGGFLRER